MTNNLFFNLTMRQHTIFPGLMIAVLFLSFLLTIFPIFTLQVAVAQTGENATATTTSSTTATKEQLTQFKDNETGFSMQYTSDWKVLSDEYAKVMFGSTLEDMKKQDPNFAMFANFTRPIVVLFPETFSGANVMVIYQALPFPMSAQEFMNASLPSMGAAGLEIENTSSISIGDDLPASKVDITSADVEFSQIFTTKGDKGFVIQFAESQEGDREKIRNDISTMVNSIRLT